MFNQGIDVTRELTTYETTTTPIVFDVRTIECVVGRVRRGSEWRIVDRSGDFARTVFVDSPMTTKTRASLSVREHNKFV